MTTINLKATTAAETLWFAKLQGVGNVNRDNARGRGNRAARRAGWYVRPTAGPEYARQSVELLASL